MGAERQIRQGWGGPMAMVGVTLENVQEIKYLGATLSNNEIPEDDKCLKPDGEQFFRRRSQI